MPVINEITTSVYFENYDFVSEFWEAYCHIDIDETYIEVIKFINYSKEIFKELKNDR